MSVRLLEALRLKPGQTVAFVGAGGKSSALGRLAAEAAGEMPIVLTTTTRLGAAQAGLAKAHLVVEEPKDLAALPALLAEHGSVVVTGAAGGREGKWYGPPADLMESLHRLAVGAGAALIIEADGARGRGLKAPAEHEPVVPPFTDLVVPVAALDVVGKPLGPEHVHRPERVAALLGKSQGDLLAAEEVARVLGAAQAVEAVLAGAPVRKVLNPGWQAGQSTSVRVGLQAVAAEAEAAVFLLADMPFIPPDLVRALVQVHRETLGPIVAPRAGGRRANPVLFDRATFDDLLALEGDRGGRALFERYAVREVPWEEGITFDLDTPEDLARLGGEQG